MTIELTNKQVEQLKRLVDDFETGYVANPTALAQRNRDRYEKLLRDIVIQFPAEQENNP